MSATQLVVEIEPEVDGRWIAEVIGLPGVLAYGRTRDEALNRVAALALRVLTDKLEQERLNRGRREHADS